ncbi:MAG: S41 family peptidase [Pseudomonadota bacterium]
MSNPPPADGGDWARGVFEPSENFRASCSAPRTGVNPATGQSYVDRPSSLLDELNYLRSFSDETYLWYDEIADRNPAFFSDTLEYFDVLKTPRTTANGDPVDRFHFTYDSEQWYQLSQTGVTAGYGMVLSIGSPTPPRNIVVAYVESGSPAAAAGVALSRGTQLLSVDGVSTDTNTASGVDTLNAALFPSSAGERHQFEIQESGGQRRTVFMTARAVSIDPVPITDVFDLPDGRRVGYLLFNDHIATAEMALINAVDQLNSGPGIDELILDVRYNGGGYLAIASELAYMIAGATATVNRAFETLQSNDKHPVTNPITGRTITPTPFYSVTLGPPFNGPLDTPLPTLGVSRVSVITGAGTCSASEAIINGLRGIDIPVQLVGQRTCGKPYGFYARDNCGTIYFTAQFRGVNEKGFGDYTSGFVAENTRDRVGVRIPGCELRDDLTRPLGDPEEARIRTALGLMQGEACPPNTLARSSGDERDGLERARIFKPEGLRNRIATP